MYLIVVFWVLSMGEFSVFLFFHPPLNFRKRETTEKATPDFLFFVFSFILPPTQKDNQIHNCFLVVVVAVFC